MKPISLQLYTLRELASKDFIDVLKKVADVGYKGVEPAGLFNNEPAEVRKVVEDLGMTVSSNHQPWPSRENINEVLDVAAGLGTDIVICGFQREDFTDIDTIKKTADAANFIVEKLVAGGLRVAVHNHYWEFDTIDGRLKYDIFMEMCPDLLCEIDTYWSANFGAVDPIEVVSKYRSRTPLLHIKDGTFVKEEPQKPIGFGKMDIPAVIGAADESVLSWLIVELDNADRDMLQAVAESYAYLTGEGLAAGNK
jgi:sugar phosphate isomerase/epimerase